MALFSIPLGTEERLKNLYSYPNTKDSKKSLADTILHWFNQTLARDGLTALGASAAIKTDKDEYTLELDGPPNLEKDFEEYGKRLPQFLQYGWEALTTVIPKLKEDGRWDPEETGQWRFFLPHGLAMINQRSLQFFHYPPIRLLDTMQDYLDDPVPVRWAELLEANGVQNDQEAWLYETVIDATPIAAPDDQGSKKSPKGDKHWGLIPIQFFPDYQKAMVKLLLNESQTHNGYTTPIVVYGSHPREIFQDLYLGDLKLGINVAGTAEIIPGMKTPVLGVNHPYRFYAQAQIDDSNPDTGYVGSGKIVPKNCEGVVQLMKKDLAAARWQVLMAENPSQDPQTLIQECEKYWEAPERTADVCKLVMHEGSLLYPNLPALDFTYRLSLHDAAGICGLHGNNPCAALK